MLTEAKLRNARPHPDGRALILADRDRARAVVGKRGISYYQKYRLHRADGSKDDASLRCGDFPAMSLEELRARAALIRKLAEEGKDPKAHFELARLANVEAREQTFDKVAEAWFTGAKRRWDAKHAEKMWSALQNHALPRLGRFPINDIQPKHVASALADIVENSKSIGSKVKARVTEIFDYAVDRGLIQENPAARVLRRSNGLRAGKRTPRPSLSDMGELGKIMREADSAFAAQGVTKPIYRAHVLAAFTGKRIGEVCAAKWSEIDFAKSEWRIPRERMKTKDPARGDHRVPLARQLLKLLKEWREDTAGDFVFPAYLRGAVCPSGVEKFYREKLDLRDRHSPNSWRVSVSTNAGNARNKRTGLRLHDEDAVKIALDHQVSDETLRFYDRGDRFHARVKLAQWWADELDRAWHA